MNTPTHHIEIDALTVIYTDENGEEFDLNAEGSPCGDLADLIEFITELHTQKFYDEATRDALLEEARDKSAYIDSTYDAGHEWGVDLAYEVVDDDHDETWKTIADDVDDLGDFTGCSPEFQRGALDGFNETIVELFPDDTTDDEVEADELEADELEELDDDCEHRSVTTPNGHGAYCEYCGETLA